MIEIPSFSAGEVLTAEKLQALTEAIKELQLIAGGSSQQVSDEDELPQDPYASVFLAKLIDRDEATGKWSWQEYAIGPAGRGTYVDGRYCDDPASDCAASNVCIPGDLIGDVSQVNYSWGDMLADGGGFVLMMETRDGDKFRYVFVSVPSSPLLLVQLFQDGGSDGDATNPATYTYWASFSGATPIKDFDGADVEFLEPLFGRPNGSMTVATWGIGKFVGERFMLLFTNEYPVTSVCVPSSGSGNSTTFADSTARAGNTPSFVGQLAIQLDTGALYRSTGTAAGDWTAV